MKELLWDYMRGGLTPYSYINLWVLDLAKTLSYETYYLISLRISFFLVYFAQ